MSITRHSITNLVHLELRLYASLPLCALFPRVQAQQCPLRHFQVQERVSPAREAYAHFPFPFPSATPARERSSMILYASVLGWSSLPPLLRLRMSPLSFALIPSYRTSLHRFRHPPQATTLPSHAIDTKHPHLIVSHSLRHSCHPQIHLRAHLPQPPTWHPLTPVQRRTRTASTERRCVPVSLLSAWAGTSPPCRPRTLLSSLPRPCRSYADTLYSLNIAVIPPFSALPPASTASSSNLAFK